MAVSGLTILNQTITIYPTYDAAATVAVANAKDDPDCFYNPVQRDDGRWAVEVLDETATFVFCL